MDIPRLHPDTIEEVKQRVDIVEVVSEKVILRKRGKDFVGLCPFHDEKTPSFSVSPSKQMYYCFGCGASGGAINFLKEINKQSFPQVVLDLAKRYQVPIRTLEPEQRQALQRQISLREQLYEILAVAANFYQHTLRQPSGKIALEYLKFTRQLREETLQQFQLGYAPVGWDTLYGYLVEQKRYPVQLVEQTGLVVPRKTGGTGYYDRFRDRVIIPICDIQGRVIGFGGRSLGDEQPKYLNSPETELFNKGKMLFALDKARDAISKQDQAVVVEGYFDAIALHAAGISNVVASLGTALSVDQVRILLRYTESKQVVLNFDADAAGTTAAERAIGELANLAYQGQVQLRILNLPDGKDADEFLKGNGGAIAYQNLLNSALLWLDWQIQQLLVNRDLSQADQFQQTATAMVALLSKISNPNSRGHYLRACAELLSRREFRLVPQFVDSLRRQLRRYRQRLQGMEPSDSPLMVPGKTSDRTLLEQAEAVLLRIYLHCPYYRQAVRDALAAKNLQFSLSHHRFLWQQILEVEALPVAVGYPLESEDPQQLISRLQDPLSESPTQMSQVSQLFHLDEKKQLDILNTPLVIQSAIASLERVKCEKRSREFLELWQKTNPATDPERSRHYQEKYYEEKNRIAELDRQRQLGLNDLVYMAQ